MGRRLGQHFLADPSILDRIVDAIKPEPHDVVVEIGPGRGNLTARLAGRVGRVIAVEKDERLAAQFRTSNAGLGNVTLVVADALAEDWSALLHFTSPFKVIGNIPYYITSPLLEKALTPPLPIVVVFLVQREFADRLAAGPGSKTFGALSAGVQAVAQVERLFTVRAGAFKPPPKVDSAVVRVTPRSDPLVSLSEHPALRTFLAALFGQRRKQLVRSLRRVFEAEKTEVEGLLLDAGVDPEARAEVLTPAQLVDLFRRGRSLARSPGES